MINPHLINTKVPCFAHIYNHFTKIIHKGTNASSKHKSAALQELPMLGVRERQGPPQPNSVRGTWWREGTPSRTPPPLHHSWCCPRGVLSDPRRPPRSSPPLCRLFVEASLHSLCGLKQSMMRSLCGGDQRIEGRREEGMGETCAVSRRDSHADMLSHAQMDDREGRDPYRHSLLGQL